MGDAAVTDNSVQLCVAGLRREYRVRVHEQGDQHVSQALRESGIWEAYESSLVLKHLKPGHCFLDIGANLGYYSVLAADAVGDGGRVIAFEPENRNFALLEHNVKSNQLANVVTYPFALSSATGEGKIFLNSTNFGDHQVYDDMTGRQGQAIHLVKGDELLVNELDRVDFIKIDTQGAEFHVLEGLSQIIRQSLPTLTLIVEFWPRGLLRAGGSGKQLLDLLVSYELDMHIIDHINHGLIACQYNDIADWIEEVEQQEGNEGFLNLFFTPRQKAR